MAAAQNISPLPLQNMEFSIYKEHGQRGQQQGVNTMPRMDRLSNYRTTWECDGERGSVTYVSTRIVSWDGQTVTLNSGGWQTVTTKRKMVQAATQFGLGYTVYQRNHEWFVCRLGRSPEGYASAAAEHGAIDLPFHDGMTFPQGTVRSREVA
jgi:hypothetical protein